MVPLVRAMLASVAAVPAFAADVIDIGACYGYFNMVGITPYVTTVALNEGFLDAQVPNKNFLVSIVSMMTECDGPSGAVVGTPLLMGKGSVAGRIFSATENQAPARVISGCVCSSATKVVSNLAGTHQVPVISGASTSPTLSNKAVYPYFMRTVPPDSMQGKALATIVLSNPGWKQVVAMYFSHQGYGQDIIAAFKDFMTVGGPDVVVHIKVMPPFDLDKVADVATYNHSKMHEVADELLAMRPQPRIFVVGHMNADFWSLAFIQRGLVTSQTAFLGVEAGCSMPLFEQVRPLLADFSAVAPNDPLWKDDAAWAAVPMGMKGFMCLLPLSQGPRYNSEAFQTFLNGLTQAKLIAAGMPADMVWEDKWLTKAGWDDLFYSILQFDAVTTIFRAFSDLLGAGTTFADIRGDVLKTAMRDAKFEGLSGMIGFDDKGDRLAPYKILQIRDVDGVAEFVNIGTYDGSADLVSYTSDPIWADGTTNAPKDRPSACRPGTEYVGGTVGCRPCDAGKFAPTKGSACFPCNPGTFAATAGQQQCLVSPKGTKVPAAGASAPTNCPMGEFQAEPGKKTCALCFPGRYQDTEGKSECSRCAKGSYADMGFHNCTLCLGALTTEGLGAFAISDCGCSSSTYQTASKGCTGCTEGIDCSFGASSANYAALNFLIASPSNHTGFGSSYSSNYVDNANAVLVAQTFGTDAKANALLLKIPSVQAGYYTRSADPLSVFECLDKGACQGGTPDSCNGKREGLLCTKCPDNWMKSGSDCEECSAGNAILIPMLLVLMFPFLIALYYLGNDPMKVYAHAGLVLAICVGAFVTAIQILGSYKNLNVPWPTASVEVLSFSAFFTVNPETLAAECVFGQDPTICYLFQGLAPFILAIGMIFCCFGSKLVAQIATSIQPWSFDKTLNSLGQIYTILFIVLATIVALPFVCYVHPNDEASVVRYPGVLCGSADHTPLVNIAILVLLLFILPYVSLCVYGNRQMIRSNNAGGMPTGLGAMITGSSPQNMSRRFRFLIYRFRPDRWWWGNVFMLRQTALAFAPLVPANDPHAQAIVVCAILSIYAAVVSRHWPWKADVLNFLDCSHCILLSIYVVAGTAYMEKSPSTDGHTMVMIMCFALVVGSVAVIGGLAVVVALRFGRQHDFGVRSALGGTDAGPTPGLHKSWKKLANMCSSLSEEETLTLMNMMNPYDWHALKDAFGVWYSLQPAGFGEVPAGNMSQRVTGLVSSRSTSCTDEEVSALKSLNVDTEMSPIAAPTLLRVILPPDAGKVGAAAAESSQIMEAEVQIMSKQLDDKSKEISILNDRVAAMGQALEQNVKVQEASKAVLANAAQKIRKQEFAL